MSIQKNRGFWKRHLACSGIIAKCVELGIILFPIDRYRLRKRLPIRQKIGPRQSQRPHISFVRSIPPLPLVFGFKSIAFERTTYSQPVCSVRHGDDVHKWLPGIDKRGKARRLGGAIRMNDRNWTASKARWV